MTADHGAWSELVAGYALDALEPEDEVALARHLPACAQCTAELRAHREALAHLAHASAPLTPPPSLLEGIRAAVSAESPDAFAPRSPAGAPPAPVVDLAERRRRRVSRPQALAAAAASVAVATVALLGVQNADLRNDRQDTGQLTALQEAVAALEAEPGRTVPMTGLDGEVTAFAVVHDDQLNLVLDGVQANDADDSVYVLWGQPNGERAVALATFDVSTADRVAVVRDVALPAELRTDLHVLAVTLEQGRTAPVQSSQQAVVSATVPA